MSKVIPGQTDMQFVLLVLSFHRLCAAAPVGGGLKQKVLTKTSRKSALKIDLTTEPFVKLARSPVCKCARSVQICTPEVSLLVCGCVQLSQTE